VAAVASWHRNTLVERLRLRKPLYGREMESGGPVSPAKGLNHVMVQPPLLERGFRLGAKGRR